MLRVHHSSQSRSVRVLWLCEELGLDYEIAPITMFSSDLKTPEYLSIHPLGKVPAIEDGEFSLWETTAIFEYLDARYGEGLLIPEPRTREGARVRQWMAYGENPLTVIMGEVAAHAGPMPEAMRIPALVDRGRDMAPALVRVVERALGDHAFIVGDAFTAADIMLAFGLNIARFLGFVGPETPRTQRYLDLLCARPAYQRAIAR
jgi:glutathione S-transferase